MVGFSQGYSPHNPPAKPHSVGNIFYLFASRFSLSDSENLRFIRLGHPVVDAIIPWRCGVPVTADSVLNVVLLSSLAKMTRVNAFRVIARMKNEKSIVQSSVCREVRHSVRQFLVLKTKVSNACHAIPLVVNLTKPGPAPIGSGFIDFIPKSFTEHMGKISTPQALVKGVCHG